MRLIRFIHLRDHLPDGTIVPYGGSTIAYNTIPMDDGTLRIFFSFADCNYLDNFCRRIGRVKAEGKLNSENYRHTTLVLKREKVREAVITLYYVIKEGVSITRKGNTTYPYKDIRKFRY